MQTLELVKALARAFRWKLNLQSDEIATIAELAKQQGITPSYMTSVLRLTLLAPTLAKAILAGQQGSRDQKDHCHGFWRRH